MWQRRLYLAFANSHSFSSGPPPCPPGKLLRPPISLIERRLFPSRARRSVLRPSPGSRRIFSSRATTGDFRPCPRRSGAARS